MVITIVMNILMMQMAMIMTLEILFAFWYGFHLTEKFVLHDESNNNIYVINHRHKYDGLHIEDSVNDKSHGNA